MPLIVKLCNSWVKIAVGQHVACENVCFDNGNSWIKPISMFMSHASTFAQIVLDPLTANKLLCYACTVGANASTEDLNASTEGVGRPGKGERSKVVWTPLVPHSDRPHEQSLRERIDHATSMWGTSRISSRDRAFGARRSILALPHFNYSIQRFGTFRSP